MFTYKPDITFRTPRQLTKKQLDSLARRVCKSFNSGSKSRTVIVSIDGSNAYHWPSR